IAEKWTKTSSPLWRWMKPKPLLALNHFTVPCSLLTALLFSVSRVTTEHNIKLSDAPSPEPLNRAAAVFKLRSGRPQSGPANKKMAASVTLRPLYYPKAIQEQQTQRQSTTGGEGMQVFYGGVFLEVCCLVQEEEAELGAW